MILRTLLIAFFCCVTGSCTHLSVSPNVRDYNAFPDIVKLPSGRIICVFYNGWSHASYPLPKRYIFPTEGGRIMMSYSDDEGDSWSLPVQIYDGEYDERDPSIALLSTGELLCSFSVVDNGKSRGSSLMRSRDGGKTWSTPTLIHPTYYTSSPVVELSDGSLAAGVFYEHVIGDSILVAYGAMSRSTDLGASWAPPVAIPSPKGLTFDAETSLIETSPGSLYAVLRTSDLRRNMHYSTSHDYGANWAESKDIGFPGHAPYLFRVTADTVLLGHRFPGTTVRFSSNNCKTWSDPMIVSGATGAYPSIVRLKNKSFLVVFYDDGENVLNKGTIKFRKFFLTGGTAKWVGSESSLP